MTIRSVTEEARDYLLAMIESLAALAIRSGDGELAILLAAVAASARLREVGGDPQASSATRP